MVHTCPWLHSKFEANLDCMRPCLMKQINKKKWFGKKKSYHILLRTQQCSHCWVQSHSLQQWRQDSTFGMRVHYLKIKTCFPSWLTKGSGFSRVQHNIPYPEGLSARSYQNVQLGNTATNRHREQSHWVQTMAVSGCKEYSPSPLVCVPKLYNVVMFLGSRNLIQYIVIQGCKGRGKKIVTNLRLAQATK